MATAVAILLVVVAAAVVLGRRGERAAEPETVGTTGTFAGHTCERAQPHRWRPQRLNRRVAADAPAIAQPSAPAVTVVLSLSRPCWVAATVDGERVIYRILQPGERHTLTAEREMRSASATPAPSRGRSTGGTRERLAPNGAVRNARITPENAANDALRKFEV